jgi:hypothetical protein
VIRWQETTVAIKKKKSFTCMKWNNINRVLLMGAY